MISTNPYIGNEAIESAEVVAAFRAIGNCETNSTLRNPDNLAKHFLGPKYGLLARLGVLTKRFTEVAYPGMYWFHLARTRHIDMTLRSAIDSEVEQVVFLGAGYDTRAYRFQDQLKGLRVYEVDLAGTQCRKLEQLRRKRIAIPNNVHYVPIDFNRERLEDVLLKSGLNPHRKTFFTWEGVSYFLPPESVMSVFQCLKKFSAGGSRLVFDYMIPGPVEGDFSSYGSRQVIKGFNKVNEPARFGLAPRDVGRLLEDFGFLLLQDYGPDELQRKYLSDHHGRSRRMLGCMRIASCEKRHSVL